MKKFNVGDEVVIVRNVSGHDFHIGDIVCIERVYTNSYLAKRKRDRWFVNEKDIEFIKKKTGRIV